MEMAFIQFIYLIIVAFLCEISHFFCEASNNSSSTYSQTSQVLLSPVALRVYFIQDSRTLDDFDETALNLFENLASEHSTNFTNGELKREMIYSVEEAVYVALYQRTILKVSSRSICSFVNWIVNTDCFSFELSPIIKYFDSEYLNQIGNKRFANLINRHTVNSLVMTDPAQQLANDLLTIPSFSTSLEIRQDSVAIEEVVFDNQFVPALDPRLSYEQQEKKDHLYVEILKQPSAVFLFISLGIFAISIVIVIKDWRYNRRDDLLKLHFQSASRAILEKRVSMEESMTSGSYNGY